MSTSVTAPAAEAAGSTRWATLWVPKVTVTAASTCGPSVSPVSTSTPDGTSTATTGTPAHASSAATASGRSPGRPPIPTIPSTTTSGRVPEDALWRGAGHTTPPAPRRAASPASWTLSDSSQASTAQPRRASSTPAYSASPPLSPEPTSSRTRRPYADPSRSSTAYASPAAARCISAPSGRRLHQRTLRGPHLLDRVRVPHGTHASGTRSCP